jgi:hypothetical protein
VDELNLVSKQLLERASNGQYEHAAAASIFGNNGRCGLRFFRLLDESVRGSSGGIALDVVAGENVVLEGAIEH